MKNFSQFVNERKNTSSAIRLTDKEVEDFVKKNRKVLPIDVVKAIYIAKKYNLFDSAQLDEIRLAKKPELKKLVDKFKTPLSELEDLHRLFKEIGTNYRMIPMYLSQDEYNAVMSGSEHISNVAIDVDTKQGRDTLAKQYMPLVINQATYFASVSSKSRADLMSAGSEGLSKAIEAYAKARDSKNSNNDKFLSFGSLVKQYIRGYILNEINNKHLDNQAMSIDNLMVGDDEIKTDYQKFLGVNDQDKIDEDVAKLISIISKKFSQRDADIFCRYFGIGHREKMKSKDIAKMYGLSETAIKNGPINKIIKYIKSNPELMEIMGSIRNYYNESLLVKCFGSDKTQIYETLMADPGFLVLEFLTRWQTKSIFNKALDSAIKNSGSSEVLNILSGDFLTIDDNIKKYRKQITKFLEYMYPSEPIGSMNDVDLIEMMAEIQEYYHKHNKK